MARPLWSGSISFGLVQIPVGLHAAEDHEESLSLTLLDKKDHAPVGYRHVNKVTGEEVPKERRVKGYEVAKNEYVILTEDDFKRANVRATETIDIHTFVDASEIPVTRFERPYYVAPSKKGLKPYRLLLDALTRTNKVGIATMVMRQRQHLCAVMPMDDVLVLEILRYDYEVAPAEELGISDEMKAVDVTRAELEMAERLIEGMAAPFATQKFRDTYHDDLMALIEERRAHPEHVPEPLPKEKKRVGQVVDIMALLKKSVEERAAGAGGGGGKARATGKAAGGGEAREAKKGREAAAGEEAPARRRTGSSTRSTRGARGRASRRARA